MQAFKFDFGLQYELRLNKKDLLTLGAIYSPGIKSKGDFNRYHFELNSAGSTVKGDTITANGVNAGIPSTLGFGFSLNRDNRLTLAADVTYQNWKDIKFTDELADGLDSKDRFNNRWKYAIGAEFMSNQYSRSFFQRVKVRGGVNFGNSYLNVKNSDNQIKGYDEYGATLGFGLPLRNSLDGRTSYININFEYKKVKPNAKNMIDEQYFGVSLNMNVNEFWFFRKKID